MIVTLCGSVRFEDDFRVAGLELGRCGIACYTLAVMPPLPANFNPRGQELNESGLDKIMLDLGYFAKIMQSDAILVLGDGYIGQSTAREILWANRILEKPVIRQCDGTRLITPISEPVKYERKSWSDVVLELKNRAHDPYAVSLAEKIFS